MFLRLGYEVHKTGIRIESTWCPPYDYWNYSQWFEDWFQEIYRKVKKHTVVSEGRCYTILRFCEHGLHFTGLSR
jgi:hypothetical protein